MTQTMTMKYKKRYKRRCRFTGSSKGLIRKYGLRISRKRFREIAKELGFEKY